MSKGLTAAAVKNKASRKKGASTAPAKTNAPPKQQPKSLAPLIQSVATCACGGGCPRCTFDGSHGKHEHEARKLAPRLVAAPTPARQQTVHPSKKPSSADSFKTVNTSQNKTLQPSPRAPPVKARAPPAITAKPDSRLSGGKSLSAGDLALYETALDMDLSHVRIHDGLPAAAVAQDYCAQAFTYGSHIVFGRQAQLASPSKQRDILAHELVHVAQQTRAADAGHPNFDHAPRAPPLNGHPSLVPQTKAPLHVQCLDEDPGLLEQAVTAGLDLVSGAAGAVLEGAAELIEARAPGLMDFIRNGGLDEITDLFCTGIDTLISRLFSAVEGIDFMSAIETAFTSLTEDVQGIQTALSEDASAVLGTLLGPLVESLQVWGGPLIRGIQAVSDTANSIFSGLWDHVAVPVLDFLQAVGGTVWETFTGFITWIWNLIEPIRRVARWAWDWLAEQFNLAWESTDGVREWLAEKATAAWEAFLELIEPIRTPLMVVGGILLLLSPLGPIIILTQVLPPLWEKITWLRNNWNTDDILVRAREILHEEILPGVINLVGQAAGFVAAAASWLAGMVVSFTEALRPLLEFFGASECLTAVQRIVNGIADQFERLATWAQGGFSGLVEALRAVFNALVAIFQPILDFLVRLFIVIANPPLLPIAIGAAIWLLIPTRLKPPVINFILDLMIAFISGFPAFLSGLGPLAAVMKAGVLGFLRRLRGQETSDELRVTASNKMANIAAGGGLEFIAGYAWGLLRGLIDGILDPFKLLFLIFKVLFMAARVIGNLLAPLVVENVPGLAAGLTQVRASLAVPQTGARAESTAPPGQEAATEPSAGPETASPAETPGAPVGARAPPAEEPASAGMPPVEQTVPAETAQVGDAEITAAISPETVASIVQTSAEAPDADTDFEADMRSEVESEGADVGGLARLLGDAWDWMISGAENLGARAAGAFLSFITWPDFQLGNKIGWLSGFILLQALIAYFTAGGYTAISSTAPLWRNVLAILLRFLDLGGEIFSLLGRALRPLRGPLMSGLEAAGSFLSRFRFARNLVERVRSVARSVFRFGDEAASAGRRGVGETAETATTRGVTGEAAENATGRTAGRVSTESTQEAGERAAREAMESSGQRASRDAVEETSEGVVRAVDEPGVTRIQDDALKAAQFAECRVAARIIAETNDIINAPLAVVLAQLMVLKRRYRWIDTFTASVITDGVYRLGMIASPEEIIDARYTTAHATSEGVEIRTGRAPEVEHVLPGGGTGVTPAASATPAPTVRAEVPAPRRPYESEDFTEVFGETAAEPLVRTGRTPSEVVIPRPSRTEIHTGQVTRLESSQIYGEVNEGIFTRYLQNGPLRNQFRNLADQVYIRPIIGVRPNGTPIFAGYRVRADNLVRNNATGRLVIFDAKLSRRAPLTTNQTSGYPLIQQFGGRIESHGLPRGLTYGTTLPPLQVFRAQPVVNLREPGVAIPEDLYRFVSI